MPNKVVQIDARDDMIISPCGINRSLCRAYVGERNPCPGCRGGDSNKSNACLTCSVMNCMKLAVGNHQFCFSCANFPCVELRKLDHRYRTRYGISTIANLQRIRNVGVRRFVAEEDVRWNCPECGSRLCMHKPECGKCGYERQAKLL